MTVYSVFFWSIYTSLYTNARVFCAKESQGVDQHAISKDNNLLYI